MTQSRPRPDPQKSLVGFAVGDINYAIPIGFVREIINPINLTRLPHLPDAISGVADHRGEVIPIVDMRARFGVLHVDERRRSKWILVEMSGSKTVGLIVDRVTGVFGTGSGLRPAPALGGGEDVRGIVGVTSHADKMVFVLDVERIQALTESMNLQDLQLAAGSSRG